MKAPLAILAPLAALPSWGGPLKGMFELHRHNRKEGRPNYVTDGFLLLVYSLTLDTEKTAANKLSNRLTDEPWAEILEQETPK